MRKQLLARKAFRNSALRVADPDSGRPAVTGRGPPSAREIALALGGDGRPDASGNYAAHCPCPAHKNGDRNASLSLKDGRDGRVLFYCFAGGEFAEIGAALRARGLLPIFRCFRARGRQ
jgi:hypothetical protein